MASGPSRQGASGDTFRPSICTSRFARTLGFGSGLVFAAVLLLAPNPAFAQHGGSGGGHGGGFGGGGGHSGGFGGSGSRGGSAGGSRGGSTARGSSGNASGGSHSGVPVVYGGSSGGSHSTSAGSAGHSTGSTRFVPGSTWQTPPSAGRVGVSHFITGDEGVASGARLAGPPVEPKGMRSPLGASTALRGAPRRTTSAPFAQARPLPPHIGPFPPRRIQPIFFLGFGGCWNGFFPGYCGYGFLPYWCDPWLAQWGCGYGGYGYGLGGYYGGGYGNTIYNDSTDQSSVSSEFNPSRYAFPNSGPEPSSGGAPSSDNEVVLFLKDGTVYAITDYWVADNKLHYVTNYGGENTIEMDQIDMQRTVDVNAKRGVPITLKPAPEAEEPAEPDAAPNSGPPDPNPPPK